MKKDIVSDVDFVGAHLGKINGVFADAAARAMFKSVLANCETVDREAANFG
ncbi:MAG: hypothetical protein ACOH14_01275 [Rhodoglobus sp.]